MKHILFFLVALLPLTLFAQLGNEVPKVRITNGTLEGSSSSGISIFRGVPYAQPPVGNLRWKAPQPVKNWEGGQES